MMSDVQIITPDRYQVGKHSLWFPSAIKTPLLLLAKEIRSESVYDAHSRREEGVLDGILSVTKYLGKTYAILSESSPAAMNHLRSRKGLLPLGSPLRKLDHSDIEAPVGDGLSRLGVVIELSQTVRGGEAARLLNWANGVLVVSTIERESLISMVCGWMCGEVNVPLSFNYTAIRESLIGHPETIILRHFAADNGRKETLVAVGHELRIEHHVADLLDFMQFKLEHADAETPISDSKPVKFDRVAGDPASKIPLAPAGDAPLRERVK